MLVLRQSGDLGRLPLGGAGVPQALLHADREEVKEDLFQLRGVDGAPVGGEAHLEAQRHRPVPDLAVRPLQHLLSGAGDGKDTAFAGAVGLPGEPGGLSGEAAEQVVLQGRPAPGGLPGGGGKVRRPAVQGHADLGGGGEGVPLHPFDVQHVAAEGPAARQGLVGGVAPVVDGPQGGAQVFRCFHDS